MTNFVQSGNFTRFIAILFLALSGIASLVMLVLIAVYKPEINPTVYTLLGGLVGSAGTFFAKASGVVDGATISQNAVNSVTGPINAALAATPGAVASVESGATPVNG